MELGDVGRQRTHRARAAPLHTALLPADKKCWYKSPQTLGAGFIIAYVPIYSWSVLWIRKSALADTKAS